MIFWQSVHRKVKFYDIQVGMLTQGGSQEFPRLLYNPNPNVHYLFHAVVSWAKLFTLYVRQVCFNIILLFSACRFRWPRHIRHGSTAARLPGLRVWIPPRTWTSISCECCVLPGTGLCDGPSLIQLSLYRVWCVWVCQETSTMRRPRTNRAVEPWKQMKLPPRSPKWPVPSHIFRLKFNTGRSKVLPNVISSCNYEQMPHTITVPHM